MAHVADELDHEAAMREARGADPFGDSEFPEIVKNPRQLRVVPWHGEGPDPLAEVGS